MGLVLHGEVVLRPERSHSSRLISRGIGPERIGGIHRYVVVRAATMTSYTTTTRKLELEYRRLPASFFGKGRVAPLLHKHQPVSHDHAGI